MPCGILAARFVPLFTKKLLNFSATDFLSTISSLAQLNFWEKNHLYSRFSIGRFHDFPSIFNVILAFL